MAMGMMQQQPMGMMQQQPMGMMGAPMQQPMMQQQQPMGMMGAPMQQPMMQQVRHAKGTAGLCGHGDLTLHRCSLFRRQWV